jgi:LPS sulfotransferase NodH
MRITKFVILTDQRSGSTWLVDILNSHPEVIAFSELFIENTKKNKPTWAGEKDVLLWRAYIRKSKSIFKHLRPFSCLRYLNYIYAYKQSINAIGFKLMYHQLWHCPEILVYLLLKKAKVVHLIRSNILDVIISKEASLIRGSFHSINNVSQVQVKLNTSNLLKRLRWLDTKIKLAKRIFSCSGVPYIEVEYEKLKSNPSSFNDILNFLGIEPGKQKLETPLRKLSKGSHMEIIANYEEVKKALKNTKYYDLLNQK